MNIDTFVDAKPELVLKKVFGYDSFRPSQKEIIDSVLAEKDTLAIMPTGGGKSLCYQIPALIFPGITIVVSPLISLMQDQVYSLESAGIHSVFLNSSLDWDEYKNAVHEIKNGLVKIVYVSPEGLATTRIRDILCDAELQISCITIDEAHCVSEWGHDFRPDYMEICSIRRIFPDATMIALTATATEQVRVDIAKNLGMKNPAIFISSFNRSNIFLEVQPKKNALDTVIACIRKHSGDSGIIYCFSRRQVDELTESLDKMGYSVLPYHAGLTDEVRAKNQELFIKDEVQIMIATVAFGMGIDKPNVRFVINYDLPKSVEEYYQEIGRAGRDGLPSHALLLYSYGDIHKIRYFFDEMADSSKAENLLQGMIKFASGRECRRKSLLEYFGEKYVPLEKGEKDYCCDVCALGELPMTDATVPVQKLLCCIIRTKERFGANYIVDVLLGSRQKRIVENGHNFISTWGIGTELSKNDWLELVDVLLAQKFIAKTNDYSVLYLTEKGRDLLVTRERVMLAIKFEGKSKIVPLEKPNKKVDFIVHKKNSGEKILAESGDENDLEALRIITELKVWRKNVAQEMNVPPYVIFGDKTMYDIAVKKPRDLSELLNVHGIGQAKAEQFGRRILKIVRND